MDPYLTQNKQAKNQQNKNKTKKKTIVILVKQKGCLVYMLIGNTQISRWIRLGAEK